MIQVALICEGPTDRVVIERMLDGISERRTVVNPIQPPHPMRPGMDFGGWEQVFASIARKDVSGALMFNLFVVIQIDTDVCERPGFGVSRREGDRELTDPELVERVRQRLEGAIREHDPEADLARVVFAVCVDEIECWLLLHLSDRDKTTGCYKAANQALRKQNRPALGGADKDIRAYEAAAQGLRKRGEVERLVSRSGSLALFVDALRPHLAA